MTDSLALNGMGGYGYYDPYFMQAYQAYNLNQAQALQAAEAQKAAVQTQAATQTTTVPMTTQQPEEKKKSNAGLIIGGLATVGAAALLYKAHKKGGEKGIKEGFRQMWQGVKGTASETAPQATPSDSKVAKILKECRVNKFTVHKSASGDWVAQVPHRSQTIVAKDGGSLHKSKVLKQLGISSQIAQLGDEGVRLREATLQYKGNTFTIRRGKVVEYKNSAGKDLIGKWNNPTKENDIKFKKEVMEIINKINKGDKDAVDLLTNAKYVQCKDGVIRHFTKDASGTTLDSVTTNRFGLGATEVTAARGKDAAIDKALKAIAEGKNPEGMKAVQAQYTIGGQKFKIENGELVGMYGKDNKLCKLDSDVFQAWKYDNKTVYETMMKNIKEGAGMHSVIWQAA